MTKALVRTVSRVSICLSLLMIACSSQSLSVKVASVKAAKDRKPAPEFSLQDSDGRTVKLSEYRGKVVLLNFWATWCGPCKIEIPWFIEFEQKHKDQGFAVLGVAMDEEGWDIVRPYVQRYKINYRVLLGDDKLAELYGGVDALPTTFLLDRDGKIGSVHVGLVSKGNYQNDIDELLGAASGGGRRIGRRGVPAVFFGANWPRADSGSAAASHR